MLKEVRGSDAGDELSYRFSLGLIYMLNLLFWASEALLGHAQNRKSK